MVRKNENRISILAPRMWGDKTSTLVIIFKIISILAPRMWGDKQILLVDCIVYQISILAPRMWGDLRFVLCHARITISILAPRMWGDNWRKLCWGLEQRFQSSPHVCEATFFYHKDYPPFLNFNPRPTYVRRPNELRKITVSVNFNPRPTYVRRRLQTFL